MLCELTECNPVERGTAFHLFVLLAFMWISAGMIVGCGGTATLSTSTSVGVALSGTVHSGQQPVVGAKVYLYAAGSSGLGSAATSLLNSSLAGVVADGNGSGYVTTDSGGGFNISGDWSCVHNTDQLYIIALEGNLGLANGSNNPALAMMAALGTCSSLASTYPYIVINEVTTVASTWALRPFIADASHIGSTSTNAIGLANAFAQVPNLVNIATGLASSKTLVGTGTVPQSKINTLSNILAPCINSANGMSTACSSLFSAATPSGKILATDTLAAALYIAQNPGNKVAALFGVQPAGAPFQPQLTSAPNDWMLYVTLSGGGLNDPASIGVDAVGNLWVANYYGIASEFSPQGEPRSTTGYTGSGLNEDYGMAIDVNNNIWFADEQSSSSINRGLGAATVLNSSGLPLSGSSGYSDGGIYFPVGITADPNGNMWVVNYGNSTVTLLNNSGISLSGSLGWGGTALSFPVALAVDSNHNAWVANQSANSITKISANGSTNTVITCCNGASGVAADQWNNVWVANYFGNSISEISNSGVVLLNGVGGGGVQHPQGIAVDGSGTVWVANYRGNSISVVSGTPSASPGTFLSPASGFGTDASLLEPYGLALDASGNAWISNFGNNTVTLFLGVAAPTKTPLAGPPQLP